MTKSPRADKVKYVSIDTICKMFNKSQYPDMIARGQLIPEYLRDDHLKQPENYKGPHCTRSQTIRYYDSNRQWVVEVHQYLRPDKTLGASGMPEPKRLRFGNTIFSVPPK